MKQSVVELVTYQLNSDVNEQQLAATNEAVHGFLNRQPGFIYRSLSRDEAGYWFDIIYWQDMATAKAAGQAFSADPAGQALIDLIDPESVVIRHMLTTAEKLADSLAAA